MPINPTYEGRRFELPEPHRVTSQELTAFASAVRSPQVASPSDSPDVQVAPPTYAVTLAQQGEGMFMKDPDAGVNFDRLVHAEQTLTHHHPIHAGDELTVVTTVQRIRSVGGNDMVTLVSDIATVDGSARCTATSMMLIRGEESA